MHAGVNAHALEREVSERIRAFAHLASAAELAAAEDLALETLRGVLRVREQVGELGDQPLPPLQPLAAPTSAEQAGSAALSWPEPQWPLIRENAHAAYTWVPPQPEVPLAEAEARNLSLAGASFAVKANIAVNAWPVTACSALYRDDVASDDAAAIRLLRQAGATFVGLTNMDELAWGGTSNNPLHGVTTNPFGAHLSASGSSGGSAVAVAEGSVSVALGTDTGGSVRLPAAACGVVGFRPSTGAISTDGVVPLAESFDTVGVIAATVARVRAAAEVLTARTLERDLDRPVRVGILPALTPFGCDDVVAARWQRVQEMLRAEGCVLEEVWVPGMRDFFDVWFFIHLIEPARTHVGGQPERVAAVGPGARVPLIAGACLPLELEPEAQRLRAYFNGIVSGALAEVDFVVAPTIAAQPQKIEAQTVRLPQGEVSMFKFAPSATWLASMAGLPAISIPVPTGSVPVGMQIMGVRGDDAGVLSFGQRMEQSFIQRGQL